jgi:hypothetical protein
MISSYSFFYLLFGPKTGRVHEKAMSSFGPHAVVRNTWDGTLICCSEFIDREVFIHMVFKLFTRNRCNVGYCMLAWDSKAYQTL